MINLLLLQPGNPPDPQGEPVPIAIGVLLVLAAAFGAYMYYKKGKRND